MAISKVRDYIESTIADIDSTFKRLDSPIDAGDTAETRANKSYSIKYDLATSESDQQTIGDSVEANIQFLFKGFRNEIGVYDSSFETVDDIRLKLLNKKNIQAFASTDGNPIAAVTSNSMTGEVLETNERQILITLSVNFLIYQTIC